MSSPRTLLGRLLTAFESGAKGRFELLKQLQAAERSFLKSAVWWYIRAVTAGANSLRKHSRLCQ